jgi:hypothetical protein
MLGNLILVIKREGWAMAGRIRGCSQSLVVCRR